MITIDIEPLTQDAFAPFGDVLAIGLGDAVPINQGRCTRHHNLSQPDILNGSTGISLFQSELQTLPYVLTMMERHPLGSQAFVPMCDAGFLVIVAPDEGGRPALPRAFMTAAFQGVSYHRNIWHGVLTPLSGSGMFCVIDRISQQDTGGENLEEFTFGTPYHVIGNA
ncbi:ureidoglycolate lyase [Amylibacter marinus]|uniref:Ureidoglycolate lyase n=1 Tax=Amylibacter marinus TaxID=1475483 RepID=A0ABQ5VVS6_9RHOB|nr:ureidoglycolate lyase [Amylibacter marinus]GLQ35203.1 ureidoglycolate lyase [Amylibacter marinus]